MKDLGATAGWTAGVRAVETGRADALFRDPWAAALAGDDGRQWAESRSIESITPMIVRHRFFDDFLHRVTLVEGAIQVVLLGAGLDTRALRLSWPPGTTVFEVDQAEVLLHKRQVLRRAGASAGCARRVEIPADLAGADWPAQLVDAGLDASAPSAWLAEGFLFYLATASIGKLLAAVSGLAWVGSWLGFDIPNRATLTHPLTRAWAEMQANAGAPWIGALDDPVACLAQLGWEGTVTQGGASDADYGRWPYPVIPLTAPELPHLWLVTARKDRVP